MASYDNPWFYKEKPFESEDILKRFGFVYLITNLTNGRLYIGRKYFWSTRKVKGKTRRQKSESDWKDYYGSSDDLKADVEKLGRENFKREILSLHDTKGSTNYTEIKEQFVRGVLETDMYYNTSINGKWRNVKLTRG